MTFPFCLRALAAAAAFVACSAGAADSAGPVTVAEAGPALRSLAANPRLNTVGAEDLFRRGHALEVDQHADMALPLYREASLRGHAAASQRLMEIYADGAPGVGRDYRAAVYYKERAVAQGASLDPPWRH